jgi:BirA family transcriptional regulator, biotin operon repressor / biotin---[acetyl-CoA-carboxylase] ligase
VILGHPRVHLRETASTNDVARELAAAGAPHGTVVTAAAQTAGRGRQGRTWSAPPGEALLLSVVLRVVDPLLPLRAAVAVAEVTDGQIKWPNDVLLDGRKVAGVLAEGRPADGWAVLGIGLNVAVRLEGLPPELRDTAATMGREPAELEPVLAELLAALERAVDEPAPLLLTRWRERDVLLGREVRWDGGQGTAQGITDEGALLVTGEGGTEHRLDAGEVHLRR